jgi:hypothetical protein
VLLHHPFLYDSVVLEIEKKNKIVIVKLFHLTVK